MKTNLDNPKIQRTFGLSKAAIQGLEGIALADNACRNEALEALILAEVKRRARRAEPQAAKEEHHFPADPISACE